MYDSGKFRSCVCVHVCVCYFSVCVFAYRIFKFVDDMIGWGAAHSQFNLFILYWSFKNAGFKHHMITRYFLITYLQLSRRLYLFYIQLCLDKCKYYRWGFCFGSSYYRRWCAAVAATSTNLHKIASTIECIYVCKWAYLPFSKLVCVFVVNIVAVCIF